VLGGTNDSQARLCNGRGGQLHGRAPRQLLLNIALQVWSTSPCVLPLPDSKICVLDEADYRQVGLPDWKLQALQFPDQYPNDQRWIRCVHKSLAIYIHSEAVTHVAAACMEMEGALGPSIASHGPAAIPARWRLVQVYHGWGESGRRERTLKIGLYPMAVRSRKAMTSRLH